MRIFLPNRRWASMPTSRSRISTSPACCPSPLNAKFTPGKGPLRRPITGAFRPEVESPDFDLSVRIVNTRVKSLIQLLRAYTGLDAAAGLFSLFSEVKVKDGKVKGYLKPIFKDMTTYDPQQDRDRGLLSAIYEKNHQCPLRHAEKYPRDEMAAKTDLAGTMGNPQASTWELLLALFQNAFFEAVLHGLEGKVSHEC